MPVHSFATFSLVAHIHYFAAGILAYFLWCLVPWSSLLHRMVIAGSLIGIAALIIFAFPLQVLFGQMLGWEHSRAGMVTVLALVLAALVLGMSFQHFERKQLRWTADLGEASFSLYLWHPFIVGLLIRFGVYDRMANGFGSRGSRLCQAQRSHPRVKKSFVCSNGSELR